MKFKYLIILGLMMITLSGCNRASEAGNIIPNNLNDTKEVAEDGVVSTPLPFVVVDDKSFQSCMENLKASTAMELDYNPNNYISYDINYDCESKIINYSYVDFESNYDEKVFCNLSTKETYILNETGDWVRYNYDNLHLPALNFQFWGTCYDAFRDLFAFNLDKHQKGILIDEVYSFSIGKMNYSFGDFGYFSSSLGSKTKSLLVQDFDLRLPVN